MAAVTEFSQPSLSPRARWKAQYHRLREKRHNIRLRASAWRMVAGGLVLFWALVAYGIHAVT